MSRHRTTADLARRILAAGCAALVMALTLFAASPLAHDWLHAGEKQHTCRDHPAPAPAPEEHDCAVVLFASTADVPVGPLALVPPRVIAGALSPVTAAEFFLISPRYLRQPERGPPTSRLS